CSPDVVELIWCGKNRFESHGLFLPQETLRFLLRLPGSFEGQLWVIPIPKLLGNIVGIDVGASCQPFVSKDFLSDGGFLRAVGACNHTENWTPLIRHARLPAPCSFAFC